MIDFRSNEIARSDATSLLCHATFPCLSMLHLRIYAATQQRENAVKTRIISAMMAGISSVMFIGAAAGGI